MPCQVPLALFGREWPLTTQTPRWDGGGLKPCFLEHVEERGGAGIKRFRACTFALL